MGVVFLLALISNTDGNDLNQLNKYFVQRDSVTGKYWIKNDKREEIIELARFEVYKTDRLHSQIYIKNGQYVKLDDGERLRLISKQGFILDNIPLYHNRYYNECIEIFLQAEKLLPKTYQCLKDNNYKVREISTCRFHFPFDPILEEKRKFTRFKALVENKWIWVWGLTPRTGADESEVTLSGGLNNDLELTILHEYIHMCGYGKEYHNKPIFECAKQ